MATRKKEKELDVPNFNPYKVHKVTKEELEYREAKIKQTETLTKIFFGMSLILLIFLIVETIQFIVKVRLL